MSGDTLINAELVILTHGAIVASLVEELGDAEATNAELDRLGARVGQRCVDEYLARFEHPCRTFKETADGVCGALQYFLQVSNVVSTFQPDGNSYTITLSENPLERHMQLPPQLGNLSFSQMLCGAIRGALKMVGFDVAVSTVALSPVRVTTTSPFVLEVRLEGEINETTPK
ncbi:Bet3-like protein [Giardia muris]|uniref:Bet3-like protein n=1 Tax=Giardia muris TaxID=5742 RepID=A0A4Z1SWD3_GIAMU|nr:Bet3-like protein [Giardia muris]|eukprot:TNJ29890.1 Bet3-like protein [Giardia muris]